MRSALLELVELSKPTSGLMFEQALWEFLLFETAEAWDAFHTAAVYRNGVLFGCELAFERVRKELKERGYDDGNKR